MDPEAHPSRTFDLAVVGAGAAGMWTALSAAELGAAVVLISRTPLALSASFHAQGGLAAALEDGDSPQQHASDTLAAGRGMCSPEAVAILTSEAPAAVRRLIELGVEFDRKADGSLSLGLEGGHTRRRIVHSGGSRTGEAITARLAGMIAATGSIELMERTSALALASDGSRCRGVVTDRGPVAATATVIATGGAAALWSRSTNPWGAIGAGPVLARAAGADLADLEFCQFHPTAVFSPDPAVDGMLITEAVRGEGALLLDADGRRFTDELAARDSVTAAIVDRIGDDRSDHVDLDLRPVDPGRFPSLFRNLEQAGFDPLRSPVPVSPAAHYTMGGVAVSLDGHSSLEGLLAVGECSCAGLHGANRLASNSLTECFVFGSRAARAALSLEPAPGPFFDPGWRFRAPTESTREALWRHAGPLRDSKGLQELSSDPYPLAAATARAALERRESRGGHRRADHTGPDPSLDGVHVFHRPDDDIKLGPWPAETGLTAFPSA